tara:strand:+ start:926 stop:1255 length:330 start_codon:yes stop_codon:yes gene_type:complete
MSKLLEALNNVKEQMNKASYSEARNLLDEAVEVHKRQLESTQDIVSVQCNDGNWNYDAYMHGLANGMLIVQSMFTDKAPVFLEAPEVWLESIPSNCKPSIASESNKPTV